jgi:hypothetical protein
MENQNSIKQSQTSQRPGPPDEVSDFVDGQLALLCANYANSALSAQDPRTTDLYMSEIEEMTRRYGQERVAISVLEAMRSSKFLPEINVLWELIPPGPERPGPDPNCGECGGSGWKTIPASGKKPQSVSKCDCRQIARPA